MSKRQAPTSCTKTAGGTESLLRIGFTEREAEQLLGGNAARFFGEVWAPAVAHVHLISQLTLPWRSPVEYPRQNEMT